MILVPLIGFLILVAVIFGVSGLIAEKIHSHEFPAIYIAAVALIALVGIELMPQPDNVVLGIACLVASLLLLSVMGIAGWQSFVIVHYKKSLLNCWLSKKVYKVHTFWSLAVFVPTLIAAFLFSLVIYILTVGKLW